MIGATKYSLELIIKNKKRFLHRIKIFKLLTSATKYCKLVVMKMNLKKKRRNFMSYKRSLDKLRMKMEGL
jgi:hypothetical protein